MTTGEKLSKLRKENGYTQEALAEILGVSRQSISKWESDGSFPETDKLIQLSRLYKCSIDYLLKPEVEDGMKDCFTSKSEKKTKMYVNGNLFTGIWSFLLFGITLLFYIFPYMDFEVHESNGNIIYLTPNIYQFLGSNYNNSFGNILILVALFSQILMLILGILMIVYNKKILYILRLTLSFIETFIWISTLIVTYNAFQIGMVFMILSSLGNLLGLLLISHNKCQLATNEDFNYRKYTLIWGVTIFIITFVLYCLPYNDYIIHYPIEKKYIGLSIFGMYRILQENLIEILMLFFSLGIKLVMMVLSILIFKKNNKKYYQYRSILAVVDFVIFCFIFLIHIFSGNFSYYLLIVLTIVNVFGILFDKNNKYYTTSKLEV